MTLDFPLQAVPSHNTLDEAADQAKEVLQELIQTLEEAASRSGYMTSMVDNLSLSLSKVCILGVMGSSLGWRYCSMLGNSCLVLLRIIFKGCF